MQPVQCNLTLGVGVQHINSVSTSVVSVGVDGKPINSVSTSVVVVVRTRPRVLMKPAPSVCDVSPSDKVLILPTIRFF